MASATGQSVPLAGLRVLVTRPAHQAEELCRLIEGAGGEAIRFPAIDIRPWAGAGAADRLARLGDGDLAVFVSANAVECARPYLPRPLPPGVQFAAVGRATARALQRAGLPVHLAPERGFDSEALLALPQLQEVRGRRVVIVRGQGGRELLADTLRRRGASVDYAEVYRRALPQGADVAGLRARWADSGIDVVVATSADGLRNLETLLGAAGRPLLQRTPLVVIGERMLKMARDMGVCAPVLVSDPSDAALVDALIRWRRNPE